MPLLVIVSGVPRHVGYPFAGLAMETDNERLLAACTKWTAVVRDASRIDELVQRAIREALSGRPGPVALELPADVLAGEAEFDGAAIAPTRFSSPGGPAGAPELIERAAGLLASAERPLLLAGGGVVAAAATPQVRAVAERLGAAATCTQMGLGVISTESPAFFGHGGLVGGEAVVRACREADVVLAVGMRFSSWWWDGSASAVRGWPDQQLIQIDADPVVIGARTAAAVGIQADAGLALDQLLAALGDRDSPQPSAWLASLRSDYEDYRAALRALETTADGRMHPAALSREIADALPPTPSSATTAATPSLWSNDMTPALEPRTRFHEPGMAHLGFGVPHALALSRLLPGRPVLNITGDGALALPSPSSTQRVATACPPFT